MNVKIKKFVGLLIFFLVIVASLLFVRPVYKYTSNLIESNLKKILLDVENKTGIRVSYKSLSPAVLSALKFQEIELIDSASGIKILEIKKVVFRYDFFKLIFRKKQGALKDLTLDGIVFDLNSEENSVLLDSFLKSDEEKSHKKKISLEKTQTSVEKLQNFIDFIPLDVFIKNVHIQFSSDTKIFDLFLRKFNFDVFKDLNKIAVSTFGTVIYSDIKTSNNYSTSFNANGNVFKNLNGSSINLGFFDITDGNSRFNRLNLLLSYDNNIAQIRTIKNAYPLFFSGLYNFETDEASLNLKTQKLNIGRLFSSKKENGVLSKLKFFDLDFNGIFDYNVKEKIFYYKSEGKIDISKKLVKSGLVVNYAFSGDENKINFEKVETIGDVLNSDLSGIFAFKNFNFSGNANIYNFTLSNGTVISTEMFFDSLDKGFMCFAPQLLFDEKSFTGLEFSVLPTDNNSIDFAFELSDYAHYDTETPGQIKINGSFITDTKYIQANMTSSSIYLDSFANTAALFAKNKFKSNFSILEPYMMNMEVYFSSDLKTFSYNIPYLLVADTKKDNRFVYASFDGNNSSISLSQLLVIAGSQMAQFSGNAEVSPEGDEAFLIFDAGFGNIPYHFMGNINSSGINIAGDYGFDLKMQKKNKDLKGSFLTYEFPIPILNSIFSFSFDSVFSFNQEEGIIVDVNQANIVETGSKFHFFPVLDFSAHISRYGAFFEKLKYKDIYSDLNGKSSVLWNINDGFFDSLTFLLNLKSIKNSEEINIESQFTNPEKNPFSGEFVKKSMYFNTQISINSLDLNKFTTDVRDSNSLTGTLIASGTLDNPYVGLNIDNFSFATSGKKYSAALFAYIEEKNFIVEKTHLAINNMTFSDVRANFDLVTFSGKMNADFDAKVLKKTIHAPLEFSVSDTKIDKGKIIPSEFAAHFSCPGVGGNFFKQKFPFEFTVLRSQESISILSSQNIGFSGAIQKDGNIMFSGTSGNPVNFDLYGSTNKNNLDLNMSSVYVDIGKLFSYFDLEVFRAHNAILTGNVRVTGMSKDPDFSGELYLEKVDFTIPPVVPSHTYVKNAKIVMNHSQIDINNVYGLVKNSCPVEADATIYFDGWAFDRVEAHFKTPNNKFAPADLDIRYVQVVGDANIDINFIYYQNKVMDVSGKVLVKNTVARTKPRDIAQQQPISRSYVAHIDMDFTLIQHCQFRFDPLLRAVFVPNSSFSFKYDMETHEMQIDGDIAMRSGDIAYLNRNFYLKNGIMKFNKNETTFNPMVTITAETREKDSDGNDVRLILSATNQYLLDLNPQISSIPAKSETEIQVMLGQIAVGDSESVAGFLLSAGDYALQTTVGRNIENKLRDLLNFDILSIRTSILQNALKQSLSINKNKDEEKTYGIGNYLDNSTVYIGKYFGSSIYADALMHWSYDESRVGDDYTFDGLVFKPEFGLEMESPFGNIRWNMAPDINALMVNKFAASTSVTLSWKFSF